MSKDKKVAETANEVKEVRRPKLRVAESKHYTQVWFPKEQVELKEGKSGYEYYIVTIDDVKVMVGKKAFINSSKDGAKLGFHIQNSREYRVFGTSVAVKGKDLIQYSIQLNTFNKQQKELKK